MKMTKIIDVDFYGAPLTIMTKDGSDYVAVNPIVEQLGLDLSDQLKTIKNDRRLGPSMTSFTKITNADKLEKITCLPLEKISGWLFTINSEQYRGWMKKKIKRYQNECFNAVYTHLYPDIMESPVLPSNISVRSFADHIFWTIVLFEREYEARKQLELEKARLFDTQDQDIIEDPASSSNISVNVFAEHMFWLAEQFNKEHTASNQLELERAQLIIAREEREESINIMKSKHGYVDWLFAAKSLHTVSSLAVSDGINMRNGKELNDFLYEMKVIRKVGKLWQPTETFATKQLFDYSYIPVINKTTGLPEVTKHLKITLRGELFIRELVRRERIEHVNAIEIYNSLFQ